MNEAETRAELIDPKLKDSGWGTIEDTKVLREHHITIGKIQTGGGRDKPLIADYVLTYKNQKLAVVEAKSDGLSVGEGVAQAKNYASKLNISFAYSSNGNEIYELNHSGLKVQRLKTHGLKVRYSNIKSSTSSLGRSL